MFLCSSLARLKQSEQTSKNAAHVIIVFIVGILGELEIRYDN